MGLEFSCPCGEKNDLPTEATPNKTPADDIVEEIMRGKLLPEELLCENTYEHTKVCLIRTDQLEGFFANRNLLKISTRKEINTYYNMIFVSNFMAQHGLVFILMQYSHGMDEKNSLSLDSSARRRKSINQKLNYTANYKIEKLNLVSREKSKVIEQILNDLNKNLKKEYLLYGIVNDFETTQGQTPLPRSNNASRDNLNHSFYSHHRTPNGNKSHTNLNHSVAYNSFSNAQQRQFKLVYKKCLIKESQNIQYYIGTYKGEIDRKIISEILQDKRFRTKILRSILVDPAEEKKENTYFFVFEENTDGLQLEYEYLVIAMEQGNNPNKMFIQDIGIKLNNLNKFYKLSCVVSNEKNMFLVIYRDPEIANELETPVEDDATTDR